MGLKCHDDDVWQGGVCPLSVEDSRLMQCNVTSAVWPDIQMHFDGCRTSAITRPTMNDQGSLQMVPNACDMDFMHWAVNGKRLEVCSGYQGEIISEYVAYTLDENTNTWQDIDPITTSSANATFWMRTYEEESGIVHMGNLLTDAAFNTTLGFLGAQVNASNVVLSSLGIAGGVNFFRCADRVACQMPEYTFAGTIEDPRLDLQTGLNFSELSLRRCGSIGSLVVGGGTVCRLDLPLFPLFAYLLNQGASDSSSRGCLGIWSVQDYLFSSKWVLPLPANWESGVQLTSNPSSLFCDSTQCIYNARPSSVLQDSNRNDAVSSLIQGLNKLFLDTTVNIQKLAMANGLLSTYEDINLCVQELISFTQILQARVQAMYNAPTTSGFYVAFELSLYEFPQQWFHQCMLNVLISQLDASITCPDTSQMVSGVAVPLDLWSSQRRAEICDPQRLVLKSGLHHIVCSMKHPAYTLSEEGLLMPALIINDVYQLVVDTANNELYENQKSSVLSCAANAAWNLPAKMSVLLQFYNDPNPQIPDPCDANSTVYIFQGSKRAITLEDIANANGEDLASFLSESTNAVNQQAPSLSYRVDYVTNVPYPVDVNAAPAPNMPIAQVWGIDTSVLKGYVDTTEWVSSTCQAAVPDPFLPPSQESLLDSDPCLYSNQFVDTDRYLQVERPVINVVFADLTVHNISLCPFEGTSQFFFQTDHGFTDTDENGIYLQPMIQEILAPPGEIYHK